MKILKPVLTNPFRRKRITNKRLRIFTEAVIQVLTEKNDAGQYDTLISALTAVYILFYGKLSTSENELTTQKSKTMVVNNIRRQFELKVHRDQMVVGSKYFKDTPEYAVFFPNGLSEYNQISKLNFEIIMDRFIAAVTTYQGGVITPQMLTDYNAIKTNYIAAFNVQAAKKADVKITKAEANTVRTTLEDQLYFTLLTLTAIFHTDTDVVNSYFDTTLLFPAHHSEVDYIVVVPPHEAKDSGLTNIVGRKARFTNISLARGQVYTSSAIDKLEPNSRAIIVEPEGEQEEFIVDLGDIGDAYIIIRNLSDTDDLEMVIDWID